MKNLLQKIVSHRRSLSFVEQIIISSTTFFSLLIFARALAKDDWGVFSVSIAFFHFLQGFQRALVTIPLVTFSPSTEAIRGSIGFWFSQMNKVAGWSVFSVALAIATGSIVASDHWVNSAFIALLIILIPHFYYEFVRRCLIQLGRYSALVMLASIAAAVTGTAVSLTFWMDGSSSATTGAMAYGSGAAVSAIAGLLIIRSEANAGEVALSIDKYLDIPRFARWSLLSHLSFSSYVLAIPIVLGFITGPGAVAILTAIRNIVQPLNTLLTAIDNVDKPKASRSMASGGITHLMASLSNTRKTLSTAGGIYLAAVLILGETGLHYLYAGKYDGNTNIMLIWVIIYGLMLYSQPAETGLFILRKPELLFKARTIAAVLGMSTALVLIPYFGAAGAAVGLMVGWGFNAIATQRLLDSLQRTAGESRE